MKKFFLIGLLVLSFFVMTGCGCDQGECPFKKLFGSQPCPSKQPCEKKSPCEKKQPCGSATSTTPADTATK